MADFPVPSFYFDVDISGLGKIAVSEVTGLNIEFEVLQYRGCLDDNGFVTEKRAGMKKTGEVTFKRGIVKSTAKDFFKFIANTAKSNFYSSKEGKLILIMLKDEKGSIVCTWKLKNAIPTKISGADLKSDQNQIAFESLAFVHSGLEID